MPLVSRSVDVGSKQVLHSWSMAVPAGRVWWALTDSGALPLWLGELVSGEFVAGDVVTVKHAEAYFCTSRIQVCEPGKLLSMTWKFPDEATSHLRVMLNSDGERTQLNVKHEGLGNETVNYLAGWHTHLLYLEALLLGHPRPMDEFWSTYDSLAKPGQPVSSVRQHLDVPNESVR